MGKKIVIDTNVLISAFGWRGIPQLVLNTVIEGESELLMSTEQLEEVKGVLERLHITAPEEKVELLQKISTPVHLSKQLHVIHEDPADNIILETAVNGEARFLISGDRHLLQLREYQGIIICTPREFLE